LWTIVSRLVAVAMLALSHTWLTANWSTCPWDQLQPNAFSAAKLNNLIQNI
jgi:hypothetical protein